MTYLSETFGPEHRPVIQFAIENSQKLKLRATQQALAKGRQARNSATDRQVDGFTKEKKFDSKKDTESSKKRMTGVGNSADNGNEEDEGGRHGKRKREKKNKKNEANQDTKNAVSEELTKDSKSTMKGKKHQKAHDRKRQKSAGSVGDQEFVGKTKSKQNNSDKSFIAKSTPEKGQANKKPGVTSQKSPQVSCPIHIHGIIMLLSFTSTYIQALKAIAIVTFMY
jgi:nucleolar protein 4